VKLRKHSNHIAGREETPKKRAKPVKPYQKGINNFVCIKGSGR